MPTPLALELEDAVETLDALLTSLEAADSLNLLQSVTHTIRRTIGTPQEGVLARAVAALTAESPVADSAGLARADHPDTSKLAALLVAPRSGGQRGQILERLLHAHRHPHAAQLHPAGLTDLELQRELKLGGNSERPRRRELVVGLWVKDTGERVVVTSSDPNGWRVQETHVVWAVTDKALDHYGR